ncbi:MAG: ABC transporter permease [Elsteraceae bacterium]
MARSRGRERSGLAARGWLPWLAASWASIALAPWYWLDEPGLSAFTGGVSALTLAAQGRNVWLLGLIPPILLASLALAPGIPRRRAGRLLIVGGSLGVAYLLCQGFAIGLKGWDWAWLGGLLQGQPTQKGLGLGGFGYFLGCLALVSYGLAWLGLCRGDAFIVFGVTLSVALIALFVFFPVSRVLIQSVLTSDGTWAFAAAFKKLGDDSIWGLACLSGAQRCGVVWNTLALGVTVGFGSTALGLAFALLAARSNLPFKPFIRLLSVLPIITPPFVIGLALILLFGRSGMVTALMSDWFDIPRSRWIYGFYGVALAQLLAFTPIAFMILLGVVQGVSPAMEEASQTLRANRWVTFRTITFPLIRPGLANAFLVGFVESLADFGNPMVLGGNMDVLSTKIFFAVVGSAVDESRAAILAIILLVMTLGAFWAQNAWIGRKSYTTISGKGDSGLPSRLPRGVAWVCALVVLPWSLLMIVVYGVILMGSFVVSLGRDYSFTLKHFETAFKITSSDFGIQFSGSAWDSLFATLEVALWATPFTAILGLLIGYLLSRQTFAGKSTFEFMTMLSFAIPGTVIGVSYILAFNLPPFELTGTGLILVICFVFRNIPVGIRATVSTLSQVDRSLDEASLTLGASSFVTLRRIMLPLLKPALISALIYSFVRTMTSVSAIIFLVSAKYNMATTYIVGRVEAGEYGIAIAYSSVLIVIMLAMIVGTQLIVGDRALGRRKGV